MWIEAIITVLTTLGLLLWWFVRKKYSYWTNQGVSQAKPSFPFGSWGSVLVGWRSPKEVLREQYEQFKTVKYYGNYAFFEPFLVICDTDLAKTILKDQKHFQKSASNVFDIPNFEKGCDALRGALDRDHRELKGLKGILQVYIDRLVRELEIASENGSSVEMLLSSSKMVSNALVSSAVGVEAGDLKPEFDSKMCGKTISKVKESILKVLKDRSLVTADKKRLDLLDLMLDYLPINDHLEKIMIAGSTACLIYGKDSAASGIANCIVNVARNQKVQKKLQDEIDESYEMFCGYGTDLGTLLEMPYMDAVVRETTRLFPQRSHLTRICKKDFKLSGSEPEVVIATGTKVVVPIDAMQRDPDFYRKPEEFDPDANFAPKKNFKKPAKKNYLPFGYGSDSCHGQKLYEMLIKMTICSIFRDFNLFQSRDLSSMFSKYYIKATKRSAN